MRTSQEFPASSLSGLPVLILSLAAFPAAIFAFFRIERYPTDAPSLIASGVVLVLLGILGLRSLYTVQPNTARVLTLFGRYTGTVREPGFHASNPFAERQSLSLRVRNFNNPKAKVNDARGNPIEIGAVVVWRVVDTAKAAFDVESVQDFVALQAETAIRAMASRYPYDVYEEHAEATLRGNPDELADVLRHDVQARLGICGVEVIEARISHLAYAQEIAQAMLRRQQAEAIVAARARIVEGAVGMVELALRHIEEQGMVKLDDERKAAMINNLLVAVVSEREAQPVINAGSLYA